MKVLGMGVPEMFVLSLVFAIIFCAASLKVGSSKGYSPALCGVVGFFLGLIGLIIVAVLPNKNIDKAFAQSSGADSLLKYKQLLDQGVISQDEFDRKKKEILG